MELRATCSIQLLCGTYNKWYDQTMGWEDVAIDGTEDASSDDLFLFTCIQDGNHINGGWNQNSIQTMNHTI